MGKFIIMAHMSPHRPMLRIPPGFSTKQEIDAMGKRAEMFRINNLGSAPKPKRRTRGLIPKNGGRY